MARVIIPKLPCEKVITPIMGEQWRNLPDRDRDGAWGIAIIQSVLDGLNVDLYEISSHLGVYKDILWRAHRRLEMNGVFRGMLDKDAKLLQNGDRLTWCHYAGMASGYTGPWLERDRKQK